MLMYMPSRMSTILAWFYLGMADIYKKLAEIKDVMQVKLNEEIAIQTNLKNLYNLEKAKASNKTIESIKYHDQVASMREEINKLNKHLVAEIVEALIRRVVLRSEIREEYEAKLAIEKVAFTTVQSRLTEEIRDITSTCDKMNVELELLTAELSASFVAFDEKDAAEVASAKVVL